MSKQVKKEIPFDLSNLRMINGKLYTNIDGKHPVVIEEALNRCFVVSIFDGENVLKQIVIDKDDLLYDEIYGYFELLRECVLIDLNKGLSPLNKPYFYCQIPKELMEMVKVDQLKRERYIEFLYEHGFGEEKKVIELGKKISHCLSRHIAKRGMVMPFVTALSLDYQEAELYNYYNCIKGNVLSNSSGLYVAQANPYYESSQEGVFEIPEKINEYALISNGMIAGFKECSKRFERYYVGYYGTPEEIAFERGKFSRTIRKNDCLANQSIEEFEEEENGFVMHLVIKK